MPREGSPVIGRQGTHAKGAARRLEILDRAIDVFRARGADGTSLRRIAEAIGVSHAALLHYFDSREQLLIAVYDHAGEKRAAARAEPERAGIESIIDAAIANVEVPGFVQLYTTLLAASLENQSTVGKEYFSTRFEQLRAQLTANLREDQRAGTVRDDVPAEHLAALIIAASDGLQIQWLLDPSVGLESTLRSLATLLDPQV